MVQEYSSQNIFMPQRIIGLVEKNCNEMVQKARVYAVSVRGREFFYQMAVDKPFCPNYPDTVRKMSGFLSEHIVTE